MTLKKLREWIKKLMESNQDNQEFMKQVTDLNKIVQNPDATSMFRQIKEALENIAPLDGIKYEGIRTAQELAENEFGPVKLLEFQSSLPIEVQIRGICTQYKDKIKEAINVPSTDEDWLILFMNHIMKENNFNLPQFIQFSSIWHTFGSIDLPAHDDGGAVVDYLKKLPIHDKIENLKKNYEANEQAQAEQKHAGHALNQIIDLIERTEWKAWKSRSQINGKSVPNHIYEIYQKAKAAQEHPEQAAHAMKEINKIADRALSWTPTLFPELRRRDEQTQQAYEEIVKQTDLK